jgi:hypothetical protein
VSVSKKIREAISSGNRTKQEICSYIRMEMDGEKFRGYVKAMIKSGIVKKVGIGEAAEYSIEREVANTGGPRMHAIKDESGIGYTLDDVMKVKEQLDFNVRQRSQLIRQAIKLLPMRPIHISVATGLNRRHVSGTVSDMLIRGYVRRLDNGCYEYVKSPKNEALDRTRDLSIGRKSKMQHDPKVHYAGEAETVEQFLTRGGKIDYSDTVAKFEKLTHEEIISKVAVVSIGYQSPMQRAFTYGY